MSDLARAFGLTLDPWQDAVLQAAMGERSNGKWAVRQVGVSAPRQQGKTQVIVARVLAGLLLFDEQVIVVSAHLQDTSREVFNRLVQLIEDNPSLEDRVEVVAKSVTREYIRMKSGQEVRFKARSTGSGRGFSCDALLLDEAQILSAAAWSAILPTMSARPNPQAWLLGTPPTEYDDGEVFKRLREAGIARQSGLAYLEWSADEGDDLDDVETWAKANPAYGTRISHEAIAAERASMSADQFARERLGMWTSPNVGRVIPADVWQDRTDTGSVPAEQLTLGVEVAPDQAGAVVSLAGRRADDVWHIELLEQKTGVAWLVPMVAEYLRLNPALVGVVADAGSPAAALLPEFQAAGVQVTTPKVADLGVACSSLLAGLVAGQVVHTGQPQLGVAAATAGKRPLGNTGMWVWSRKNEAVDITPIQAVTWALWAAQGSAVRPYSVRAPARKRRKVTVLS